VVVGLVVVSLEVLAVECSLHDCIFQGFDAANYCFEFPLTVGATCYNGFVYAIILSNLA